jgi:hypothetical protein
LHLKITGETLETSATQRLRRLRDAGESEVSIDRGSGDTGSGRGHLELGATLTAARSGGGEPVDRAFDDQVVLKLRDRGEMWKNSPVAA